MGDDPPHSGEAEGRKGSSCYRGAPVAVGILVAHPRIDETGTTLHHLGTLLRRSGWPTGTRPEVAPTVLPAGRNPGGRYYKEHEAYLYNSADKNLTPNKRKRLYSQVFGGTVKSPRSRAKYDDFNDVTPVSDKAEAGYPSSTGASTKQMYCDFPHFSHCQKLKPGHGAVVPVQLAKQFLCPFLDKVVKWRNHSVTGRVILFFWRLSEMCMLTPLPFCIQASQECSGAFGS